MSILLLLIISYILLSFSLRKVFEKAGVEPNKALIPGINFVEWCKLIGRPSWWAFLLLVPIVNIFIFAGMCVDLVRSFKKYDFKDSALAVVYPPLAFFLLGKDKNAPYDGPTLEKEAAYQASIEEAIKNNDRLQLKRLMAKNPYQKSAIREWVEAIVFAVFAAAFIRMFLIEAYVIPTSSMEGSLLVGDYLFVSKAHYGIRTPETVAMIPLLHNRIPILDTESYLESPSIAPARLPSIETIDKNDPVVFNYPEGDSVYVIPGRTWSIYDKRRNAIPQNALNAINQGRYELVTRPIDKMDHYIKRCVATPGDSLEIIDRQLYINGQPAKNPTHVQFRYLVKHQGPISERNFSDWGISQEDRLFYNDGSSPDDNHKMLVLSEEQKGKIKAMDPNIEIIPNDMYDVTLPENMDFPVLQ
ncbi:MAG: signal peptidase I, partial [Bacteroidota bacterium]